jgi:hypothetical protein
LPSSLFDVTGKSYATFLSVGLFFVLIGMRDEWSAGPRFTFRAREVCSSGVESRKP